jgi:CheY-like chemotaxis protein
MVNTPYPDESSPQGLSVLIVEDETPVAQVFEAMLRDIGHRVMDRARTVAEALATIAQRRPDAVLLDVNLAGEPAYRVAELLKEKGIPFVVATGYAPPSLPAAFDSALILRKPLERADLKRGLEIVIGRRR